MNPYQAPAPVFEPSLAIPKNRGLGWVLFSFDGRINRGTYWLAYLGSMVVMMAFAFTAMFALGPEVGQVLLLLLYIPMAWIGMAITVKRWHDRGKSGWWVFIGLVPIIGGIWAFVECGLLEGDFGTNAYGPPQP